MDYSGPVGGAIAGAVIGTTVAISTFWIAMGLAIWKFLLNTRIEELKALRAADNERCAKDMAAMAHRITELETMTIMYGGARLSRALSDTVAAREVQLKEGGYWQIGGPLGAPPVWIANAEEPDHDVH